MFNQNKQFTPTTTLKPASLNVIKPIPHIKPILSNNNNNNHLVQSSIHSFTTINNNSNNHYNNNNNNFNKFNNSNSKPKTDIDPFGNGVIISDTLKHRGGGGGSGVSSNISKQYFQKKPQQQQQQQQKQPQQQKQHNEDIVDLDADTFEFDFSAIDDTTTSTATTSTTTTTTNTNRNKLPFKPPTNKTTSNSKLADDSNKNYADSYPPQFQFPMEGEDDPPEIDDTEIGTYVYPDNMPIRDYQYNIVTNAFYKNTLVCLPTGLGKTLIASVLMLNYYRWFPKSKIIFMVHSRPLVTQQMGAFHSITGVPECDSIELTGHVKPTTRQSLWEQKRVFFLTPQVLEKDIESGRCDPSNISLVVVDEAHKATGDFAYCTSIQLIAKRTRFFRIIALTASPGSKRDSVQQVLSNLLISNMDIRTENSLDIQPYVHKKSIEVIVVPLSQDITTLLQLIEKVQKIPYINLQSHIKKPLNECISSYAIKQMQLFQSIGNHSLASNFFVLSNLLNASATLSKHGMERFMDVLENIKKPKRMTKPFKEVLGSAQWSNLVTHATAMHGKTTHGKLVKLGEVVTDHFKNSKETSTRVMIFVDFKSAVKEIVDYLGKLSSLIKVMEFYGQSDSKGKGKGLKQSEQASILTRFRSGSYNTLVTTCIGEEGLDFGEVDLIVCFDTPQSTVRNIQRMGRTGRKRNGRCVILLSEGAEESIYNRSVTKLDTILKNTHNYTYYRSERLIPNWPKEEKRIIEPVILDKSISSAVKVKNKTTAFVTGEQLRYLQNNYQINDTSISTKLDIEKWIPFNSMPTQTHMIDHSVRSLIMIDIMESIQNNKLDELTAIKYEYNGYIPSSPPSPIKPQQSPKPYQQPNALNSSLQKSILNNNNNVHLPKTTTSKGYHTANIDPMPIDLDDDFQTTTDPLVPDQGDIGGFEFDFELGSNDVQPLPSPKDSTKRHSNIETFIGKFDFNIVPTNTTQLEINPPPRFPKVLSRPENSTIQSNETRIKILYEIAESIRLGKSIDQNFQVPNGQDIQSEELTKPTSIGILTNTTTAHTQQNLTISTKDITITNNIDNKLKKSIINNNKSAPIQTDINQQSKPSPKPSPKDSKPKEDHQNISFGNANLFNSDDIFDTNQAVAKINSHTNSSPLDISFSTPKKVKKPSRLFKKATTTTPLVSPIKSSTNSNNKSETKNHENNHSSSKQPKIKRKKVDINQFFDTEADVEDDEDSFMDSDGDEYDTDDSFICDSTETSQDNDTTQSSDNKKRKKPSMISVYLQSISNHNDIFHHGRHRIQNEYKSHQNHSTDDDDDDFVNPEKNKYKTNNDKNNFNNNMDTDDEAIEDMRPLLEIEEEDESEKDDSEIIQTQPSEQTLDSNQTDNNNNNNNNISDIKLIRRGSSFNSEFNVNVWNGEEEDLGDWSLD